MKTLNFSTSLREFNGQIIPLTGAEDSPPFTLRDALLGYLAKTVADMSNADQPQLYALGMRIGTSNGEPLTLSQPEYDALKRLCDKPPPVPMVVAHQVKALVDAAIEAT